MHVIGGSTHGKSLEAVLSRNSTKKRPEPILDFRHDNRRALLSREDNVDELRNVGMGHNQPSLRDFRRPLWSPALKRRAIGRCPSGTALSDDKFLTRMLSIVCDD